MSISTRPKTNNRINNINSEYNIDKTYTSTSTSNYFHHNWGWGISYSSWYLEDEVVANGTQNYDEHRRLLKVSR